jgi:hypothetical protein
LFPPRLVQDALDVTALRGGEAGIALVARVAAGSMMTGFEADEVAVRERHRHLDHPLELAQVPRPGVREQTLQCGLGQATQALALLAPRHLDLVRDEHAQVLGPRAQGRHRDGDAADPVEEVAPESGLPP